MFIEYYDAIEHSNLSSEDKNTLKEFLELLGKYKYEPDKSSGFTNGELSHIFQIAKINPRLQIKIWRNLPDVLAAILIIREVKYLKANGGEAILNIIKQDLKKYIKQV